MPELWFNGRMAADLDYAFLAESARTDGGTISAVGASFTEVFSTRFPSALTLSVAGRIRRREGDPTPAVHISWSDPDGSLSLEFDATLEDTAHAVRYDGKIASVFAFTGPVTLPEPGLYVCRISVDGVFKRRLAFQAISADLG